jgi:hypothetical protein
MDPGAQIRALRAALLLSGVRRLPFKETKILTEEHKAVLLVVIGYRIKGGSPKQGWGLEAYARIGRA